MQLQTNQQFHFISGPTAFHRTPFSPLRSVEGAAEQKRQTK